jgi:hypothetical protein
MMRIKFFNPELGQEMQSPSDKAAVRASYQRTALLLAGLALTVLVGTARLFGGAIAEEDKYDRARTQHPELFKVYYDENVLEYCGLLTHESALGFVMRRDDLLAARPLSEEDVRDVRVAGAIAADMAYGSHGLAQSAWCKGEGMEAFNRFVERYRATPYGTANPTERMQ